MRSVGFAMVAGFLAAVSMCAHAKDISKNDLQVCKWGAGIAGAAQQSKLSGTTLYSARKKLRGHKFAKPWMSKMALGITEQTYKSPSRLKPPRLSRPTMRAASSTTWRVNDPGRPLTASRRRACQYVASG